MNVFTWLWIAWGALFLGVEGSALVVKDRPGRPRTLSAHIWWLVRGAGAWHRIARGALALGLAWLTGHLMSGG